MLHVGKYEDRSYTFTVIGLFFLLFIFWGWIKLTDVSDVSYVQRLSFCCNQDTSIIIHPVKTRDGFKLFVPSYWAIEDIRECSGLVINNEYKSDKIALFSGDTLQLIQSKLDAILIDTGKTDLSKITKEDADKGSIYVVSAEGNVLYHGELESIKGRGNTTWINREKKPYKIKLSKKCSLFGLNKGKKFNLLAEAFDLTKLKNWLAFKIAEEFGIRYPVHGHHVAVWFNGVYNGVYLLTESVDLGKSSIDIHDLEEETLDLNGKKKFRTSKLKKFDHHDKELSDSVPISKSAWTGIVGAKNPTDISGGYVVEFLPWVKEPENKFCTQYAALCLKSPKCPTVEQIKYVKGRMNSMLKSVMEGQDYDAKNPTFERYINIDSYARYYIFQELLYGCDACYASVYHVKNRNDIDSLFYVAPAWDFDISMKSWYNDIEHEAKSYILRPTDTNRILLFPDLYKYQLFRDTVQTLYYSQLSPILHSYFDSNIIDIMSDSLSNDIFMDKIRWNEDYNYTEEVESLKKFMNTRISFVDQDLCRASSEYYRISTDVGPIGLPPHNHEWHVSKGDSFSFYPHTNPFLRLVSIESDCGFCQDSIFVPSKDEHYMYKWRELTIGEKIKKKFILWKDGLCIRP